MYEYLENLTEIAPLPEIVMGMSQRHTVAIRACGGMPTAILLLCLDKRGVQEIEEIQKRFWTAGALDFAKTRSE